MSARQRIVSRRDDKYRVECALSVFDPFLVRAQSWVFRGAPNDSHAQQSPVPPPDHRLTRSRRNHRSPSRRPALPLRILVDLRDGAIEHDLFRSIPVDLMFHYNFVPLKAQNGTLEVALIPSPRVSTPIVSLASLLHRRSCASGSCCIPDRQTATRNPNDRNTSSKKSPKASRSTSSATMTTRIETRSVGRLAAVGGDIAPVIKLVDTSIFARSSGAPAISVNRITRSRKWSSNTASTACFTTPCPRSPRTGAPPSFRASRSRASSISPSAACPSGRRFPHPLQINVSSIFRVSIMLHDSWRGRPYPRARQRVDEQRSSPNSALDRRGIQRKRSHQVPALHRRTLWNGAGHGPHRFWQVSHHALSAALSEIKNDEDKIITIERSRRVSAQGNHADPGQR